MEKNGWGSIYPKSHWGVKPKIIPKNNKLFLQDLDSLRDFTLRLNTV